ncbi:hypothetical protein [Castellaniella sp.]|uniref:hypothetical protein n=1 Tax=Castellaniella sp. TaxID=1955812 RepID=UPI002AFE8BCC|nr:hypothetical protein [Castellaniella sp.]
MTTPTIPPLPHPVITKFPNTEVDAVPDAWNGKYAEIDENFEALRQRAGGAVAELEAAKGDAPTFAEKMNQVTQAVQDLGGDLGSLQGMTAPMLARAVRLDWDYSGNNISMEMWAGDYTLMDTQPVSVISAVAGDDSIDVEDSSTFKAGQRYVVYDGAHREQVLVEAVLTGTRVRVADALTWAYGTGAFLARTSFAVADGTSQAQAGDVYFSKPINLGFDAAKRSVVIRRQPTDAIINVDYLTPTNQWKSAPLAWTRADGKVPAGYIDCEYEFAIAGDTALRVTVSGGTGATEVQHIIGLGTITGLRGQHTPPLKPAMANPLDGAEGLTDRPTLALTNYVSLTDTSVDAVQFQVSTTADFAEIMIDSGAQVGGLSWREVGLRLEVSSTYYVRGRARDAEGAWSPWSDAVSFSTADSFVYIQAPTNVSPADKLENVGDTPTLTSSSFAVYAGGDTQEAAQWQIREAGQSYDAAVLDTGDDTENFTSFAVPADLLKSSKTEYFWRVRHKGQNIGWGEWSVETKFTTKKTFGTVIGIALVTTGGTSGQWSRIDEDGGAKPTDAAFFNAHPTYSGIVDQTIDGQQMVKIPAFYIKEGIVPSGTFAGKTAIWVSDKKESGFQLHPAFMDAGQPLQQFWIGKYKASNGTGNVMQSVPGVSPLVSINFPTMAARATARNTGGVTGFQLWHVYMRAAIQTLALIELGNPDAQTLIAQGHVNSSAAQAVDAAATLAASWRGIIGLWGNVWEMFDGLQTDAARKYKVWDKNGNKTYVTTNQIAPASSGSYIVTMSADEGADYDLGPLFMPATVDGSISNGTYADGMWSAANCVAYHGGNWLYGALCGLFCLGVGSAASYSGTHLGGRLAKV